MKNYIKNTTRIVFQNQEIYHHEPILHMRARISFFE